MAPKALTNLPTLDQINYVGLVLDILSFSGGENTIGKDQELQANEARTIKNWDIDSIAGMFRSKGFTLVATAGKAIEAKVFTGSGLNDLTSGGTYTDTASALFTIIIDHTGTPDTFKWKKGSGSFTTGVSITGSAQTLSNGVTVTFAATTGHTLNDQWTVQATVYSLPLDLLAHHFEGTSLELYGVIDGDLVKKSSTNLAQEDIGAFTTGVLCHSVSAASALWITNSTDNLKRKTIGNAIGVPSGVPAEAKERIYEHNFRLIAEGGSKNIYGSRAGTGNWTGSGAWNTSNDAWSMVMPDFTKGAVPGFPSGTDLTVFTEFDTFVVYNQPNVARRRVNNGIGSASGYAVARGNEGVFLVSKYPTLGVFLWNGSEFINLTAKHDFINSVDLTKRIFGFYKNGRYYFIYNELGSGLDYPHKLRIYDSRFGRWMERPINAAVGDNFGYPALLTKLNNEIYLSSSRASKVYDFEDSSTSDNGENTKATYLTKAFSSRDFKTESGGGFAIDNVRMKFLKMIISFKGSSKTFSLLWRVDRGKYSGSQTFDLTQLVSGDLINTTFIVNTSQIIGSFEVPIKTSMKSFSNGAVGREIDFQILNVDTGTRLEIKKVRIHALALEEL